MEEEDITNGKKQDITAGMAETAVADGIPGDISVSVLSAGISSRERDGGADGAVLQS